MSASWLSVISTTILVAFLLLQFCPNVSAASARSSSADSISANSVTSSLSRQLATRQVLVPAMQSLVTAPVRLLRQLLAELGEFFQTHSFRQLLDFAFLRQVMTAVPTRVGAYYNALVAMETECLHRTVCDLTDLTSRQMPKWMEQAATIYLSQFQATRPIYQVMLDGLTSRKCARIYADCNPDQFLARINSNLSEVVATTVAPIQAALSNLVNVTTTTLSSLAVGDRPTDNDQSPPPLSSSSSVAQLDNNRLNSATDDDDDEEERSGEDSAVDNEFRASNRFNAFQMNPNALPVNPVEPFFPRNRNHH